MDGEMREVAGLPSPCQVSSLALCSLFPSLLYFRRSIKPALDFNFVPNLCFPLDFPPARSISRTDQRWRPPHPPWRPEDAFRRLGGRLATEADAIRMQARRGGRLPPQGRLDA